MFFILTLHIFNIMCASFTSSMLVLNLLIFNSVNIDLTVSLIFFNVLISLSVNFTEYLPISYLRTSSSLIPPSILGDGLFDFSGVLGLIPTVSPSIKIGDGLFDFSGVLDLRTDTVLNLPRWFLGVKVRTRGLSLLGAFNESIDVPSGNESLVSFSWGNESIDVPSGNESLLGEWVLPVDGTGGIASGCLCCAIGDARRVVEPRCLGVGCLDGAGGCFCGSGTRRVLTISLCVFSIEYTWNKKCIQDGFVRLFVSRGVAMVFLAVYRHSLLRAWPRWSTKAVYTSSRQRNALLEREEVVVDSSVYGVVGVAVSIGRFERSIVKGW